MWEEIYKYSKEIGIDDLGLVNFSCLECLPSILQARKNKGLELPIEAENIEDRINPNRSLEDGKCILVAFWQIPFHLKLDKWEEGRGTLASISWEKDYHDHLKLSLKQLDLFLSNVYGEQYRSHLQVDTGPLYERGFALKTFKGFQGKNGSFIHRELGSFVTIGLLLINVNLKADREQNLNIDSCGSCQRCIQACPGKAISLQGHINPHKCRSWITQKKGDLTMKEEKILGNSIYGCDVCQRVCPKNEYIHRLRTLKAPIRSVELEEIQNISNRQFKNKYGHLSGSWRGASVWKRNAKIVYKNMEKNGIMYRSSDDCEEDQ